MAWPDFPQVYFHPVKLHTYVARPRSGRIQMFHRNGSVYDEWATGIPYATNCEAVRLGNFKGNSSEYMLVSARRKLIILNKSGSVLLTVEIPGARKLHGLSVDLEGRVYLADYKRQRIYRVTLILNNGTVIGSTTELFADKLAGSPVELCVKANRLFAVINSAASTGDIVSIDLETKQIKSLCRGGLPEAFGLQRTLAGHWLVATTDHTLWINGATGEYREVTRNAAPGFAFVLRNRELILPTGSLISFRPICLASYISVCTKYNPQFKQAAKKYAKTMVKYGRDRYGTQYSPLFASTIDRQTLNVPDPSDRRGVSILSLSRETKDERSLFGERKLSSLYNDAWGIRQHDRSLSGSNPMHDQALYRLLYSLSELTGSLKYAVEADKALGWFLSHCQSPKTGLLAWGEHLSWDFYTESRSLQHSDIGTHEFFQRWGLWEVFARLNREAFIKFAKGLWKNQIHDRTEGFFSRHAGFDRRRTDKGFEFPRHGGYYIHCWSYAYAITLNPIYLRAISTLLSFFNAWRNVGSDAIPAMSDCDFNNDGNPDLHRPLHSLSYATDLWESAARVPIWLANKMRSSAMRCDRVFLSNHHDLSTSGKGFVKSAFCDSLAPGDPRNKIGRSIFTHDWAFGYGNTSDSEAGMLVLRRYRQLSRHSSEARPFRILLESTANRYLTADPDVSQPVWPRSIASAIMLLVASSSLFKEPLYLERAEYFGRWASKVFLGDSALPSATSSHDHNHYESITGGPELMNAFLTLSNST